MEVHAPVDMWLEAIDLFFLRLSCLKDENNEPLVTRIKFISGACQQHGSVFWNSEATQHLRKLSSKTEMNLLELLHDAFSWNKSPNWQDRSTQSQCEAFENAVEGGAEGLAQITGSKAHHRFTGPQILKLKQNNPSIYESTSRISLVSSFLATVLTGNGKIQELDRSDACGMNMWDIQKKEWCKEITELFDKDCLNSDGGIIAKLGRVKETQSAEPIAVYFAEKYGLKSSCQVVTPFTGDNPATVLAQALGHGDVIISLGTSTTVLVVSKTYAPSSQYHIFNHPIDQDSYMGMVCYSNGSLAREKIRDALNLKYFTNGWFKFDDILQARMKDGIVMGYGKNHLNQAKVGIYFPMAEIVPPVKAQTNYYSWRQSYSNSKKEWHLSGYTHEGKDRGDIDEEWHHPEDDVLGIIESQGLSIRERLSTMLSSKESLEGSRDQPRRVYFVGGTSANTGICLALGRVLNPLEGMFRLTGERTRDACAYGAALKAIYYAERPTNTPCGLGSEVSAGSAKAGVSAVGAAQLINLGEKSGDFGNEKNTTQPHIFSNKGKHEMVHRPPMHKSDESSMSYNDFIKQYPGAVERLQEDKNLRSSDHKVSYERTTEDQDLYAPYIDLYLQTEKLLQK